MTQLHLLSIDEREEFFDVTAEAMNIPFEIIEKDFWVVFLLERLFSLNDLKNYLTFKGGTSLSKIYNLIQRFSEDVDLSIQKEFFGFSENNNPEKAISKKKQRELLNNLSTACSAYIQKNLVQTLRNCISEKLQTYKGWNLEIDKSEASGQTLQFEYPSKIEKNGYIRSSVKIELGARSEHWPVSQHSIQSYAKIILKDKITEPEFLVKVLDAKRTFWEKATILHQYAHLPNDKKLPPRISRHFYDFYCLLNSSIKNAAMIEDSLLERVAIHKSIYFASAWANYGTARKGTLKLLPPTSVSEALEKDFNLMKDMFFGNSPDWIVILNKIKEFEEEFNDY